MAGGAEQSPAANGPDAADRTGADTAARSKNGAACRVTLPRSSRPWHLHFVEIVTDEYGDFFEIRCHSCGGGFPDYRRLGTRSTFRAAQVAARRHKAGRDRHARYLADHPLSVVPPVAPGA